MCTGDASSSRWTEQALEKDDDTEEIADNPQEDSNDGSKLEDPLDRTFKSALF
jgi:hypothetical protein